MAQAYWFPLYAHARRLGVEPHEAEDVVQGFFARLLETSDLARLVRGESRFRASLWAAQRNHVADRRARELVGRALARLETEYRGTGRGALFDALRPELEARGEPDRRYLHASEVKTDLGAAQQPPAPSSGPALAARAADPTASRARDVRASPPRSVPRLVPRDLFLRLVIALVIGLNLLALLLILLLF
ncbi:MAG: hypothetical protein JNK02_06580 [Planctomycetes bacterium]|nr:hypothetical protein [Planctomycetota bacterium]